MFRPCYGPSSVLESITSRHHSFCHVWSNVWKMGWPHAVSWRAQVSHRPQPARGYCILFSSVECSWELLALLIRREPPSWHYWLEGSLPWIEVWHYFLEGSLPRLKVSPATNMMETKPKKLLGNCYKHIMGITLTHQSGIHMSAWIFVAVVCCFCCLCCHGMSQMSWLRHFHHFNFRPLFSHSSWNPLESIVVVPKLQRDVGDTWAHRGRDKRGNDFRYVVAKHRQRASADWRRIRYLCRVRRKRDPYSGAPYVYGVSNRRFFPTKVLAHRPMP